MEVSVRKVGETSIVDVYGPLPMPGEEPDRRRRPLTGAAASQMAPYLAPRPGVTAFRPLRVPRNSLKPKGAGSRIRTCTGRSPADFKSAAGQFWQVVDSAGEGPYLTDTSGPVRLSR